MKEYTIPETISEEIFNLPCVNSICKSDKSFIYVCMAYTMEDNQFHYAKAGDTLVELDNGKWRLIKKFDNINNNIMKKIVNNLTYATQCINCGCVFEYDGSEIINGAIRDIFGSDLFYAECPNCKNLTPHKEQHHPRRSAD